MPTMQRTCWILLALAVLPGLALGSEESADDLLESLDDLLETPPLQTGQAEEEAPPDAWTQLGLQLVENFHGSFRTRLTQHVANPNDRLNPKMSQTQTFSWTRLNMQTWVGDDIWKIKAAGWLQVDNLDDTFHHDFSDYRFFQDRSRQARYAVLNELTFQLHQPTFDLTVGKTFLENGVGLLFSPADVYTAYDYNDPINRQGLGRWLIRADIPLGQAWTLTGVFLPIAPISKMPDVSSRWVTGSPGVAPFPGPGVAGGVVPVDYPDITAENFSYFARLKGTLKGWDLYASAYYGLSNQYVLPSSKQVLRFNGLPNTRPTMPKAVQFSGGFSTTHGRWKLYGENFTQFTIDHEDDDYTQFLVGTMVVLDDDWVTTLGWDRIDLIVEYAKECIIRNYDPSKTFIGSRQARMGTNTLMAELNIVFSEKWNFQYIHANQLDLSGQANILRTEWEFVPDMFLRLGYEMFHGRPKEYVGRWDNNSRFVFEFEVKF